MQMQIQYIPVLYNNNENWGMAVTNDNVVDESFTKRDKNSILRWWWDHASDEDRQINGLKVLIEIAYATFVIWTFIAAYLAEVKTKVWVGEPNLKNISQNNLWQYWLGKSK